MELLFTPFLVYTPPMSKYQELISSPFIILSISSIWRDIDTIFFKKLKSIDDCGTHLIVEPTIYFMCLSLSKLHTSFIMSNGDDIYPSNIHLSYPYILFFELCYFNIHLYDNFWNNGRFYKKKKRYWHKNQSNGKWK